VLLFHNANTAFVSAYNAVTSARESGTRSKLLITTKETVKAIVLKMGRELYAIVQRRP
jgi:nitric oxide reductase activation protein